MVLLEDLATIAEPLIVPPLNTPPEATPAGVTVSASPTVELIAACLVAFNPTTPFAALAEPSLKTIGERGVVAV